MRDDDCSRLSDDNQLSNLTAQGTMAALVHEIFGIPTGFQGLLISNFARLNLDHVVDDVNDEVLVRIPVAQIHI